MFKIFKMLYKCQFSSDENCNNKIGIDAFIEDNSLDTRLLDDSRQVLSLMLY